jgi:pimeloyl-ACP methyl ester carboxylesterase
MSNKELFGGPEWQPQLDWTFGGTWPYRPQWFQHRDGMMHYVDEGPRDGKTVVLVHGNPTWGYLYRNFILPLLKAGYRVVVPDHLGFGRSQKPDSADLFTIPKHAERLGALLDSLSLSNVTFVVQDWGGPIALSWATRHPEKIRSLCILNTFAHKPKEKLKVPLPLQLFKTPGIGEFMAKGMHMFVKNLLFKVGVTHPERFNENSRSAYLAPHPTWSSRTAVLVFPREIPAGPEGPVSEFLGKVEQGLVSLASKPIAIIWAMKDPFFTPYVLEKMWKPTFPKAPIYKIEDAGHFLQEDAHEVIVPRLLELMREG